jgi:hypothetical protein
MILHILTVVWGAMGGVVGVSMQGREGRLHVLQGSVDLTHWDTLLEINPPVIPFLWTEFAAGRPWRFQRVLLDPEGHALAPSSHRSKTEVLCERLSSVLSLALNWQRCQSVRRMSNCPHPSKHLANSHRKIPAMIYPVHS